MKPMLTCQELIEFLDDYVEGSLAAPERRRFEEHLAVCPACVRYLSGYRGTVRAISLIRSEAEAIPEDVPQELIAAILAIRRTEN